MIVMKDELINRSVELSENIDQTQNRPKNKHVRILALISVLQGPSCQFGIFCRGQLFMLKFNFENIFQPGVTRILFSRLLLVTVF